MTNYVLHSFLKDYLLNVVGQTFQSAAWTG